MRIHSFCKSRIILYLNLKVAQETSNILCAWKDQTFQVRDLFLYKSNILCSDMNRFLIVKGKVVTLKSSHCFFRFPSFLSKSMQRKHRITVANMKEWHPLLPIVFNFELTVTFSSLLGCGGNFEAPSYLPLKDTVFLKLYIYHCFLSSSLRFCYL